MSLTTLMNFYKPTLSRRMATTGALNMYVTSLPTVSAGWLVVSPSNTSLREIIRYSSTGTDSNGTYLVISASGDRGLGGTTAQTHEIGEAVRMNYTSLHQTEISNAIDQIVAAGAQDASTTTKGITKLSVAPVSATIPIAVGDNDPRVPTADPTTIFPLKKFGGTGADGALTLTSGSTNIDLASAQVVTKNYTSISITGTGSLTFTNPHANGTVIILKSQGNVTLTSSAAPMVNCSNTGASGGAGVSIGASTFSSGNNGSRAYGLTPFYNNYGSAGVWGYGGGAGGAVSTFDSVNTILDIKNGKYPLLLCGAGGASGAVGTSTSSTAASSAAGRGGGGLVIECGGALNFTTSGGVSVAGSNGGNGSGTGSYNATGSGGGSGGIVYIIYNSLTASSGTVTVSGGTAGTGARVGVNGTFSGGGGAGSAVAVGSNGQTSVDATAAGGAGAAGYSLVALNTEFA